MVRPHGLRWTDGRYIWARGKGKGKGKRGGGEGDETSFDVHRQGERKEVRIQLKPHGQLDPFQPKDLSQGPSCQSRPRMAVKTSHLFQSRPLVSIRTSHVNQDLWELRACVCEADARSGSGRSSLKVRNSLSIFWLCFALPKKSVSK